ncbi:hypothetical protein LTR78_004995 [Recurvomyces mirabilis]|uniref:Bromo domain-containing protein n=1 Tax=Recurvomyces mirabilis TaxID=574656 RepID=A0AAE1C1Z7_9PEZI|nr:hypothetical protein LTR78_004995 [Recurvomyces mirabilis]KAK5158389.1 hypothetical protein LTS14_003407 [Recurvomyces mirabilis]
MSSLSSTTAYTPLESLLLFQALRHEASNNNNNDQGTSFSFNRISEQLHAVAAIRNDASYDSGRLSPDALRELYLWLLKEEVKRDLQTKAAEVESHATTTNGDGDASPGSRKRKAPSPTLPTVQEATQHAHLIPQLVTRLYATYREKTIKEIRDHERKYDALSRDLADIDAGKWDERSKRGTSATQSPRPSTSAHVQTASPRPDGPQSTKSNHVGSPLSQTQPEGEVQPPKRYSQAKIDAVMNHDPEPPQASNNHRRTSSNTTLPPLSEMAPQSPHYGIPPKMPTSHSTNMPLHLQQQPQYGHPPQPVQHAPYQPSHAHSMASPQLQNPMSRPSSSPRPILPPPPGMKLPPPSPVQMNASPIMRGSSLQQQHYPPQHRASMGPSPTNSQPPHGYPPPLPPPSGYYQPQPQYIDRRTSYPAQQPHQQQPPRYAPQPTHQGGYQLQPWPVDNSQQPRQPPPARQPYYPSQPQPTRPQQTTTPRAPAYPPTYPATAPRPAAHSQPKLITDIVAVLATPPRAERKPLWKSAHRPPPISISQEPARPIAEPLSPVLQRRSPTRPQRGVRGKAADAAEPKTEPTSAPQSIKGRTRRARERSPHSATSSTADDTIRARTRGQSVSTAASLNAAADEGPTTRSSVKHEPSTPAETVEVPDSREVTATPATGRMTRKRRGTLQSQPQPASKRNKRQQHSPSGGGQREVEAKDPGTPPPRPTTVTATRNLNKITGTLLARISDHKYGNLFTNPVASKLAESYNELIHQPQNLKQIRQALAAGSKAVSTAIEALDTAPDPSTTSVELPRSADLVPPRGIVNATQLEREVLRMFVNCVSFNPGEDGLVADARRTWGDVEGFFGEWKVSHGVGLREERGVEEQEDGDVVEEKQGKAGKRRKM